MTHSLTHAVTESVSEVVFESRKYHEDIGGDYHSLQLQCGDAVQIDEARQGGNRFINHK